MTDTRSRSGPAFAAAVAWLALASTGLMAQDPAAGSTGSLSLAAAVRRVVQSYPAAAAATAEVDRSQATLRELRSTRVPRLFVEAGGTRFQEPMIVAPLHGFDLQSPPDFERLLIQGRALATYTLFDGGARSARLARGRGGVEEAEAASAGTVSALVERATRAYVEVSAAREIAGANAARVAALSEERARTDRMLAAGSVPRVAVLRADAALASARADSAAASAALRQSEADLARLIGSSADSVATLAIEAVGLPEGAGSPDREALVSAAVEHNAAVERAQARLVMAEAGVDEARAAWWPVMLLNGGYNAFGSAAGDYQGEWQAALQLSYPVFTGGARGAAVDRSIAAAAAARAALAMARLDAAAAVDAALAQLAGARSRVRALATAVEQFAAVVDVEALSLDAGAGVQSEYLRAVSDLLDARAALTRARATEVGARVALARITGELDPSWIAGNLEVR